MQFYKILRDHIITYKSIIFLVYLNKEYQFSHQIIFDFPKLYTYGKGGYIKFAISQIIVGSEMTTYFLLNGS